MVIKCVYLYQYKTIYFMWDRRYTSCQVMVNVVSEDGLANATKGKIGHVKEEVLYRNLDRSEWGE